MRTRINFSIKTPNHKGRASFSIFKTTFQPNGTKRSEIVKDARIDSVNLAYKKKIKDFAACRKEMEEIRTSLYLTLAPRRQFREENLSLVEKYWEEEYSHRNLVDPVSAKNSLYRAIAALGSLSLISATSTEIQKKLVKKSPNKQRRLIQDLNQLLKFLGRKKIAKPRKVKKDIKHLTCEEVLVVLSKIEDQDAVNFYATCFATGARHGEAFAISHYDATHQLVIKRQMTRQGHITETKNRLERRVPVIPMFNRYVEKWANLRHKEEHRSKNWSKHFKATCKKAFPDQEDKWCTVHDLRHSYAIYLISKGVSLSLVSQALGNSIQVTQEHYAGFVLTSESVDAVLSKLK